MQHQASFRECGLPRSVHGRVALLHAVVCEHEKRGAVESPGIFDGVDDVADARIGVAHGGAGELAVRPTCVTGFVGEHEAAPGQRWQRSVVGLAPGVDDVAGGVMVDLASE